jgi:hypothetical protein
MVKARIHRGRVELQDPIPEAWDGQMVKLVPLTSEDPNPDLERQLAALHALGPMEFEAGERQEISAALKEMDRLSKEAMAHLLSPPR